MVARRRKSRYSVKTIDGIIEQLEEGKSLILICKQDGMPGRSTVYSWAEGDDELAARLQRAREIGYHYRAELAVAAAKSARDPVAGRLAFDAERWYLGKLSIAFRDKPVQIGTFVGVGSDDAFAAVAGALDRAAAEIASGGGSTRTVALPGPTGPGDAGGGLADLAGSCGEGLGQDADGS